MSTKHKCELRAAYIAIGILSCLLIIIGVWYGLWYDPDYFNTDKKKTNDDTTRDLNNEDTPLNKGEFHKIDIITISGTFMVLFAAIIYFYLCYQGEIWGYTINKYAVKSHTTEAFPMYTAIYTFGIGLLMPLIRFIIQKGDQSYSVAMYSYYPIVFICMMIGYYLYEVFKLKHYT